MGTGGGGGRRRGEGGELIAEEAAAREADASKTAAEWERWDAERREARAKAKAATLQAKVDRLKPPTKDRSDDEWAALSIDARWKAAERERDHLLSFFGSHKWRIADVADALQMVGWVRPLFESRPFFDVYFEKMKATVETLEKEEYGITFGLYLHYEARLTFSKLLAVSTAASKKYDHGIDRYKPKVLLGHKYLKGVAINVPRVAPPISKLEPKVRAIEKCLGVEHGEDGTLAFVSFDTVMQEVLSRDTGRGDMPELPFFLGGHQKLPLVISWDATGYGSQQFNTIAVRNPYLSAAAQQLHTFALGNCDDGRDGTARLLGPNLEKINALIRLKEGLNASARTTEIGLADNTTAIIAPDIKIVTDLSALRHGEHLAASGFCGCSRDFALRQVPTDAKPTNHKELLSLLGRCFSHSCKDRFVLSHSRYRGRILPCTRCSFGHNEATAEAELAAMLETEAGLAGAKTKAGKAAFSRWRMAHASSHLNVQPGNYGKPFMHHHLDDQILDPLHLAELGLPKIPWKHGIMNNASDDARVQISEQLKQWNHPLDTRRKDDGRCRAQKWFTGEKWASFCAGLAGSPPADQSR